MNMLSLGTLVISLDLELYWGMRDVISIDDYQKHLVGVRQAIPAILELFEKYKIHATWATVGFLYYADMIDHNSILINTSILLKKKIINSCIFVQI
jgi:hypothetical protein